MPAKCILFDLDGTLVDTIPDIVLAVNWMREEFELDPLPGELVKTYVGNGIEKLLERSLGGTGVTPDEARDVFKQKFSESLNQAGKLYPGVFEGLQKLHSAGIKLALLSNKPEDFCKFILFDFGIGGLFDVICGGREDCPLKPDPTAAFSILDFLGVTDKKDVWMFGDSVPDLATGRRAGLNRAFAAWGYGTPGNEFYHKKFDSFADFTGYMLTYE